MVRMGVSRIGTSYLGRLAVRLPVGGLPSVCGTDASQDYFSDGLTEDIISGLGRFSGIAVISKSAVFRVKEQSSQALKILKARYIVEGSVRKEGNRVRVGAQLTDTAQNLLLWSEQYDRQLTDIFDVQDDITRSIVGALASEIGRIEEQRALRKSHDLDAYDLLLRGRAHIAQRERAENLRARELLEEALLLDDRYAAALAALGWTYYWEVRFGWTEFTADALKTAEKLAQRALAIEPQVSEAHQLLGLVYLARNEYSRAKAQMDRAIELNPSDAYSYAVSGATLAWQGHAEAAIRALRMAVRLDPFLQPEHIASLGFAYYLLGEYETAVSVLEQTASGGADYIGYAALAASFAMLGRQSDAEQSAREVKRRWPFFKVESFVGQWGDQHARRKIAEGLRKAGLE